MPTQEFAAVTTNVLTPRMFYAKSLPVTFMNPKPMPLPTFLMTMTTTGLLHLSPRLECFLQRICSVDNLHPGALQHQQPYALSHHRWWWQSNEWQRQQQSNDERVLWIPITNNQQLWGIPPPTATFHLGDGKSQCPVLSATWITQRPSPVPANSPTLSYRPAATSTMPGPSAWPHTAAHPSTGTASCTKSSGKPPTTHGTLPDHTRVTAPRPTPSTNHHTLQIPLAPSN